MCETNALYTLCVLCKKAGSHNVCRAIGGLSVKAEKQYGGFFFFSTWKELPLGKGLQKC